MNITYIELMLLIFDLHLKKQLLAHYRHARPKLFLRRDWPL